MQLTFCTDIFLANEQRATPLLFSCVLKRRVFVFNRLFYDACSAEKSQVLICPQENSSFDSIGFYDTLRFSSFRSRNFEPEEIADIRDLKIEDGSCQRRLPEVILSLEKLGRMGERVDNGVLDL